MKYGDRRAIVTDVRFGDGQQRAQISPPCNTREDDNGHSQPDTTGQDDDNRHAGTERCLAGSPEETGFNRQGRRDTEDRSGP